MDDDEFDNWCYMTATDSEREFIDKQQTQATKDGLAAVGGLAAGVSDNNIFFFAYSLRSSA